MNLQTARRHGLWSGYIVRQLGKADGLERWLADPDDMPEEPSTDVIGQARYFYTHECAADAARFAGMMSMQKWVAVATAPQESAINGRVVKPIPAGSVLEPGITPREAQMAFDAAVMAFQLEDDDLDDELEAADAEPFSEQDLDRVMMFVRDRLAEESDDLDDELEADSYALDFSRRERRIVTREIDLLDATRAVLESERPGLPAMFPMKGGN